ncbi:MAG: ArnT family glycosyltransferase [Gaiella sp.]
MSELEPGGPLEHSPVAAEVAVLGPAAEARAGIGAWLAARSLPAWVGLTMLACGAFVFLRALGTRTNYDEGVYLSSLAALREGQALGSEVYTSQPPGFYAVLQALAAPAGDSIAGIRVAFALLALAGVVAAMHIAWRLVGPWAGVAAGALVVIGPPFPTVAPTIAADVPSVALGLIALAFVLEATRPRSGSWFAVVGGAAYGLAVATKLLALPFAAPIVAVVLARRCGRRVLVPAAAGAVTVAAVLAVAHASALPEIWAAVVGDHRDAKALGSYSQNVDWLFRLLDLRTPFGWLAPVGLVCFLAVPRARKTWPLWTLVPAAWAFLILVRPLADHHLVLLSAAYGLAAGASIVAAASALRPQLRLGVAGALALFVAAGIFQEQRRLHRNDVPEPAEIEWAAGAFATTTLPGSVVISDQPIAAFRARRSQPGRLVDVSNTRVSGGTLSADEILKVIDEVQPAAVLAARMFRSLPAVMEGLDRRLPAQLSCGDATLFLLEAPSDLPLCEV